VSALGVHGDPGGWQHAGYTLASAVSQLTAELQAADAGGGSGLGTAWHGPMAESYLAAWNTRHGHYGDLVHQVGRGASALIDFGDRLADFQARAARLESHWLGTGLHLTADGLQFTVPHGVTGLAQDVIATLRGFAVEAAHDVTAMWHDIAGAVRDLVTTLESVIGAVEDFQAISYTAVGAALGWAFHATLDDWKQPWGPVGEVLAKEIKVIKVISKHDLDVAKDLGAKWSTDADADVRAAGRTVVSDAQDQVDAADRLESGVGKVGGGALTAVTVAFAVAQTAKTAGKEGWINSIEDHSDQLSSVAAGLLITGGTDALAGAATTALIGAGAAAAAPILVPIGIAVAGGLVCAGIGALVKHEVDNHRAGTTRGLTDIGDGLRDVGVQTGLIAQPAS
jgi:hypothetical protein